MEINEFDMISMKIYEIHWIWMDFNEKYWNLMNLTWFQWKVMKSCEFDMNSIKSYEICWICHDFTEKVWNLSWAAVGPGPSFWNDLMKTLVWWMWLHPLKLHVVIYRLPHCSSRHKEEGHDILHICIFFMYVHTTRDVVLCQMSVPATLYTKTQINLQHDRWKQFLQSITSIPHAGLNFCAFARLRANTRRTVPFTNLPLHGRVRVANLPSHVARAQPPARLAGSQACVQDILPAHGKILNAPNLSWANVFIHDQ